MIHHPMQLVMMPASGWYWPKTYWFWVPMLLLSTWGGLLHRQGKKPITNPTGPAQGNKAPVSRASISNLSPTNGRG